MKPLQYPKKLFYIRTQLLQAMKDVYILNIDTFAAYDYRFYMQQKRLKMNYIRIKRPTITIILLPY